MPKLPAHPTSEIPEKFKICEQFGRGCPLVVTKWAAPI